MQLPATKQHFLNPTGDFPKYLRVMLSRLLSTHISSKYVRRNKETMLLGEHDGECVVLHSDGKTQCVWPVNKFGVLLYYVYEWTSTVVKGQTKHLCRFSLVKTKGNTTELRVKCIENCDVWLSVFALLSHASKEERARWFGTIRDANNKVTYLQQVTNAVLKLLSENSGKTMRCPNHPWNPSTSADGAVPYNPKKTPFVTDIGPSAGAGSKWVCLLCKICFCECGKDVALLGGVKVDCCHGVRCHNQFDWGNSTYQQKKSHLEDICVNKCPHCLRPYWDSDACMVVKCEKSGSIFDPQTNCGNFFCGICHHKASSELDAEAHVKNCDIATRFNLKPPGTFVASDIMSRFHLLYNFTNFIKLVMMNVSDEAEKRKLISEFYKSMEIGNLPPLKRGSVEPNFTPLLDYISQHQEYVVQVSDS
jgi:hypothetical protein